MLAAKLASLILGVCLLRECSCVIWEFKESSNGEIKPQVFELSATKESLRSKLQDLAKQVTGKAHDHHSIEARQAVEEPDISTATTLTNDSHFNAIVHWTGYPRENMFILTRKVVGSLAEESWLWRSTDYGRTFSNETDKLNGSVIQQYYVSSNTSYLIFADVISRRLQITADYGETYSSVNIPFTPDRIRFQSLLAPNFTSEYILGYDAGEETLWASTDLGYNWIKIGDNVPADRYYWRRLGSDIEGDLSTVYFEQRIFNNSNESMLYFTTFPYTSVQLFSSRLGLIQAGSFVLAYEYMFVQKPGSAASSNITYSSPLWISYKRERRFQQAFFPFLPDVLEHLHYSIIGASEGLVLLAAYHDINTTHLYTSDVTGTRYTLSLKHITGPPREDWSQNNPKFDVHVVEGSVGTLLANQRVPGKDFGTTLISHNKGGIWSLLSPPAVDRNNRPILCTLPDCSLHLRMESDVANGYQSILSQHTAVGLLMAVGNIGKNLSRTTASSRVYLSRDGGFTWAEVEAGRWEFQYLALGSIIVMVRKQALINSVKWSCDEGETWRTSTLEEGVSTRIVVIGMKTELGEKPRLVTVFGLDYFDYLDNNFEWIIFTLNFTSVVPRQCNATEYFDWAPVDERPFGECLLGEVVTYERRNSSSCCYVDPDYQKPTEIYQCPCSIEDYECDFGFERLSVSAPCTPVPGYMYPPSAPLDCPEGENYTYSSGYRKIPGDRCIESGADISAFKTLPCPIRTARGSIDFSPNSQTHQPGVSISFTFKQTEGSRVSTVYRWDFNDSTSNVEVTGFNLAQTQQHIFTRPGIFYVTLSTSNEAGTFKTATAVYVLDTLVEFSVRYPPEIIDDTAPIGVYLEFDTDVVTQYGTKLLTRRYPFLLSWDFGDGTIDNLASAVGHFYRSTGNFTISTSVEATYSTSDKIQRRMIRTYQAARTVVITSEELIQMENRDFARVQQPISFQARAVSPSEIPPQTAYTWQVQTPQSSTSSDVSSQETLTYNFPTFGEYYISVTGDYFSTGSLFGRTTVYAESDITRVVVDTKPTVRVGTLITFQTSLLSTEDSAYTGPITVIVTMATGVRVASHSSTIMSVDEAVKDLSFTLRQKGSFDISVDAFNDISEVKEVVKIVVVDAAEYGAISILFNTEKLPKNYEDSSWQESLLSSLGEFMATKFNWKSSLIEIEGIAANIDSNKDFLTVDVNILPADYTESDIQMTFKVVENVVADVIDKTFKFNVDGVIVTADNAYDRNKGDQLPLPSASSSNPLLDIILAVVIVLVAVIFLVVLIIIIYFCHRRNKQLKVKYSHLEESAGGNLAFNEAYENDLPGNEKEKEKEHVVNN